MHIEQFLDLVLNAKAYEEKLNALKKVQKEAQETLDLVGPAKEIMVMRAVAKTDLERVAEEVKKRRDEVAAEEKKANEQMTIRWNELSDKQRDLAKQEAVLAKAAEEFAATRQKLADEARELKQKAESLAEKDKNLKARETELNDKIVKLKALAQ
jgi:predicted RNase H-like nuclease (RuvC/YqgF family)